MTVSVQTTFTASVASGSTAVFPYGFKIAHADDLTVTLDGVPQTTGFTVSGVGDASGGDVTFDVNPTAGTKVVRYLNPILKRETDYQQFGDWMAAVVNLDMDRLWLAMQMLAQNTSRSLKLPVDTATNQEITEDATARANKSIKFDGDGNLTVSLYDPDQAQTDSEAAAAAAAASASSASGSATAAYSSATAASGFATDAEASAVAAAASAASVGFTVGDLQSQSKTAFTTAGSAGTLTVTTTPAYGALAAGQRMRIKFSQASTGTDTLNRDTLGAKSLKQYDSAGAKAAAVFAVDQLADVEYDGTDMVVLDQLPKATELPSQTGNAGKVLKTNGSAASWDGAGVSGTSVATTSGTSIDFTSIPSWVKRIKLMLGGVSTNGSSNLRVRLGTGGTPETTGYLGGSSQLAGASIASINFTAGFDLAGGASAASVFHGAIELILLNAATNHWAITGSLGQSNQAGGTHIGGAKALAGTLDMIRLTTVNGTDTFDAGLINIIYE